MKQVYRVLVFVSIAGLLWFFWPHIAKILSQDAQQGVTRPQGQNTYQMVTGDRSEEDRNRWDALFNTQTYIYGKDPAEVIVDYVDQLPNGLVLDIAMGEGRNAVYLAKKGFKVEGVDYSAVALRKARRLAKENNVTISTVYADLRTYQIKANHYQVILNINYLQRDLIPMIKKGLVKGGVVVFENYTTEQLKNDKSINRDWLLEKGELRQLFSDLEVIHYSEVNDGKDASARLVARKK